MKKTNNDSDAHQDGVAATLQEARTERRRFSTRALFGTRTEIVIIHNNDEYRLRITSNGKLILTK